MDVNNLRDIYTDYLLVCPSQITATGLSSFTSNEVCHDKFTRLLASSVFTSKSLWNKVKPICYEIKSTDAVLIFDDSIEEKKYTDKNELIQWHYDHSVGRSVKGVNFLTALYHSKEMSMPVCVDFVRKTKVFIDKNGKLNYKSEKSKNEMYREMLFQSCYNLDFTVVISKQVFKNGDGSTVALYLASSDLSLTYSQITTIYKKRWKVEEYHKSIKSNAAFAKSPTRTPRTQTSHFIASIMAYVKLERMKVRNNKNNFAMKTQILLQATKAAYQELHKLS